jgi:hypothetical protein
VAIDVKLQAPNQHFMLLSRTVDLSSSGAFVRSSRALVVGANVSVQFDRGEERNPLTFDAEVIRVSEAANSQPPGFAVRFTNTTALDEALIADLISRTRN